MNNKIKFIISCLTFFFWCQVSTSAIPIQLGNSSLFYDSHTAKVWDVDFFNYNERSPLPSTAISDYINHPDTLLQIDLNNDGNKETLSYRLACTLDVPYLFSISSLKFADYYKNNLIYNISKTQLWFQNINILSAGELFRLNNPDLYGLHELQHKYPFTPESQVAEYTYPDYQRKDSINYLIIAEVVTESPPVASPEPSGFLLLASGFSGFAFFRKYRLR